MNTYTLKRKSKLRKRIIWIIVLVILIPFFGYLGMLMRSDALFVPAPNPDLDFTRAIRDNVPMSARVIDIAMLGTHNAFSHAITRNSPLDPNDDTVPAQHPILLTIAPGTFARFGRNQLSDASGLLHRGVRYFDVRISYADGWYTENTLLSAPLRNYIYEVIEFLQRNPGELVIFDINDARFGGAVDFDDMWNYISSVAVNGQTLFDFVHNPPHHSPLYELTLYDATLGGQAGGVIIFARTADYPGSFHYDRYQNVRRIFHEQRNTADNIAKINAEHQYLQQGHHDNLMRISQSQLAPALWGPELVNSLLGWSYIRANAVHNAAIIDYEGLAEWLTTLPIQMFGAADSSLGDFNERIMGVINEFNRNLR